MENFLSKKILWANLPTWIEKKTLKEIREIIKTGHIKIRLVKTKMKIKQKVRWDIKPIEQIKIIIQKMKIN